MLDDAAPLVVAVVGARSMMLVEPGRTGSGALARAELVLAAAALPDGVWLRGSGTLAWGEFLDKITTTAVGFCESRLATRSFLDVTMALTNDSNADGDNVMFFLASESFHPV